MADSVRTAVPPTPVSPTAYKPISALAVAALLLGILTTLLLVGFGVAARIAHRPFLNPVVMLMAFVALGLAIAAKLQLARSQGTRAGDKVANAALLLSLVVGLGYAAYWFAIDFAIRKQSQEIAEKWIGYMMNGDVERAFRLTRDPGQQRTMSDDPETIRQRFGQTDLSLFNRSDLPRLLRSWKGRTEYSFEGVHNWEVTASGFEVELRYAFRFPEGIYGIGVTTLGIDDPDTGERTWQIVFGKSGARAQERQLTKLGKLVLELQYDSFYQLRNWYPQFRAAGPKAVEPLIRLDGAIPPEDKRAQIAKELMEEGAMNLNPGGPSRPLGYALVEVTDDGVYVTSVMEVTLPSVGKEINTLMRQRVRGDELVKEMLRLGGLDWRTQPPDPNPQPELPLYEHSYEPVEINIRPSGPKMGLRAVPVEGTATTPPTPKQ